MNRFAAAHPEDWEERLDQLTDHADMRDEPPARAPRGQRKREVLAFLRDHPSEAFTEGEIARRLRINPTSVMNVIPALIHEGEIEVDSETPRGRPVVRGRVDLMDTPPADPDRFGCERCGATYSGPGVCYGRPGHTHAAVALSEIR